MSDEESSATSALKIIGSIFLIPLAAAASACCMVGYMLAHTAQTGAELVQQYGFGEDPKKKDKGETVGISLDFRKNTMPGIWEAVEDSFLFPFKTIGRSTSNLFGKGHQKLGQISEVPKYERSHDNILQSNNLINHGTTLNKGIVPRGYSPLSNYTIGQGHKGP